jgi:hypothetical protein
MYITVRGNLVKAETFADVIISRQLEKVNLQYLKIRWKSLSLP